MTRPEAAYAEVVGAVRLPIPVLRELQRVAVAGLFSRHNADEEDPDAAAPTETPTTTLRRPPLLPVVRLPVDVQAQLRHALVQGMQAVAKRLRAEGGLSTGAAAYTTRTPHASAMCARRAILAGVAGIAEQREWTMWAARVMGAIDLGIRRGERLRMRNRDVDYQKWVITLPETKAGEPQRLARHKDLSTTMGYYEAHDAEFVPAAGKMAEGREVS